VKEDGTRTVFFELNGQPREVRVIDRAVDATLVRHPKADPDDPDHVAAPMPGKVSSVAVEKGQAVKTGDRLLSIEAMKMETAVYSPRDCRVAQVAVKAGSVVEARDLIVILEG
jgi:pyruvate carboxylase